MIKKIILFLFLIVIYKQTFACDCIKDKAEEGYQQSDIVFIGKIKNENSKDSKYEFQILELLKGDYKHSQIKGATQSNCSLNNFDKGLWLIYARFEKDSTIDVSICSASRSFYYPFFAPPMMWENNKTDSLEREVSFLNQRHEAFVQLLSDIELYRYRKAEIIKNAAKTPETDWTLWLSVLNLVGLIAVVMWLIFKKKKN